ncbi:MAG: hypothetical protein FWE95_06200 [Planctomycetaceae bacterium]|nr:hypothetical protein [Planctomycetaceae bacterium]
MSILEGLVKAEVSPDTTIDMSKHAGDTYNIEKIELKIDIGNLIVADKELVKALVDAVVKRQIAEAPSTEPQP